MSSVSKKQAWYCVVLLCALAALSFVDRYILSLVAHDVSQELDLTDGQMGLLLGLGFAVVYSVVGFPAAHLIDQSQRVRIVAIGVFTWSLSTMASAFTHDFLTLALCRSGIAAGEAVLGPAAISLIGDLFTREERATPVAAYATIGAVMGTGALAVGGAALSLAHVIAPMVSLSPWRITMLIIGFPGIVLAAVLVLTVTEPPRQEQAKGAQPEDPSIAAFLRELKKNIWVYAPFYVSTCALTAAIFGLTSWAPTLLIRLHGMQASQAGYLLGLIGVPAALLAAFFWPNVAKRVQRRGSRRGIIAVMLSSSILLAPALVLSPLGGTPILIACGIAAVKFINSTGVLAPLALVTIGPANMRGRLMAIYTACATIFGLSVGALAVPALATIWSGERWAMAYAIAVLGLICAVIMVASLFVCYRAVRKMADEPLNPAARNPATASA